MSSLRPHISPSELNTFDYCRGKWALQYIFKIKGELPPKFWRGKAVEIGLDSLLHGRTVFEAIAYAEAKFDAEAAGRMSDEIKKERDKVKPMVEQLVEFAATMGPPVEDGTQVRVDYTLDGISLPFLMYLDFLFASCIVELKTSDKCEVTMSHKRQGALYSISNNLPVIIVVVTTKKILVHPLTKEERDYALDDVRDLADSLLATIANRTPLEVLRACRLRNRSDRAMDDARKALLGPTNIYLEDGQTRKERT